MTGPAAGKARATWDALNRRQRLYLAAIYDADQAAERQVAGQRRDWGRPPPASVWRWVIYSIKAPKDLVGYTSIQDKMRDAGELDSGAGSSLAALRRRGLVQVRDGIKQTILGDLPTVEVRLTTAGRAAARAGLDEAPRRRTPPGPLSEWLWGALAKLYRAGNEGTLYGHHAYHLPHDDVHRGPSWNALLQLRDRRDGAFMEEFSLNVDKPSAGSGWARVEYRVRATPRARTHYELHYRCYRELYPGVDAVEPASSDGAHIGLADHTSRRPHGLVGAPDWRLLAQLASLDHTDRCYLRRVLAEPYTNDGRPVPEDIATIPNGLLYWQIKNLTRSTAVVDRLANRPGGAFVEVIKVPNRSWHRYGNEPDHWPLVCLTAAGRDHVRAHFADYHRFYPDINVDDVAGRPDAGRAEHDDDR